MGRPLNMSNETAGMLLGLVGVAAFSMTMPLTRLAVLELDPLFVALARNVIAAVVGAVILLATRQLLPSRRQIRDLLLASLGIVLGFPILATVAMRYLPSVHGAVVLGVLPMTTAVFGALLGHERPSPVFWLAALVGAVLVVVFALKDGGGALHPADLLLFGAVCAASFGYVKGAQVAREIGGWQVICWIVVLGGPVLFVPFVWLAGQVAWTASPAAWASVVYLGLISQLLGFFPWYIGLAMGGSARVGQVQLLQPFLSLIAAALLLNEALTPSTLGFGVAVMACVLAVRRSPIRGPAPNVAPTGNLAGSGAVREG